MSIKHSKFRNTYLIYEFLLRQSIDDYLNNNLKKISESKAFSLIKKYFSKGLLKEELSLYQSILDNKTSKKGVGEYIIKECLERHKELPRKKVNSLRYGLIGEIRKTYDINDVFSSSINDYKDIATTFLLFESNIKNNIAEKANYMSKVLDNITTDKKAIKENVNEISNIIKNSSDEEKEMAINILINSYNKKFNESLNKDQKKVISEYMYNYNSEWTNKHISKINNNLKKHKRFFESKENMKYLNLKITECLRNIKNLQKKKIVQENEISKILMYYNLDQQLNEAKKIILDGK